MRAKSSRLTFVGVKEDAMAKSPIAGIHLLGETDCAIEARSRVIGLAYLATPNVSASLHPSFPEHRINTLPNRIDEVRHEIALASRMLAHENVLDAFGHVSMRHPTDPGRY